MYSMRESGSCSMRSTSASGTAAWRPAASTSRYSRLLRGFGVRLLFGRVRGLFLRAHGHAGLHGDRSGIQNQRQIGVAQHRGAGIQADVLEHRAERLDHNLLRIGQPIHHQAEAAPIGVQNGDEVVPLREPSCARRPGISSRSRKTSGSSLPRSR